jgi:predicted HTH domain antitoxin
MNAMTVNMNLPLSISEEDVRILLAIKLFEVGKVSLGQAAKIARFSKRAFIDVLGHYQIPVCNYDTDELRQEIEG